MYLENYEYIEIIRKHPLPKLVHGSDADYVFQPFDFGGVELFQYYDSNIECWSLCKAKPSSQRSLLGGAEEGGSAVDIAALDALAFLPSPELPERLDEPTFRAPFWFGDRQFVWFLLDLNAGWHIAICRDPMQRELAN